MGEIKEGLAQLEIDDSVFYNPKMKKLRDISVLFLQTVCNGNEKLLDATAATGIRGIRYLLEVGIKDVVFLDMNSSAYKMLAKNLVKNNIKSNAYNQSIQTFTNTTLDRFDVIDLDPFGTPVPNIFDLLKIAKDKSIFMITATDTAVLCGAHSNACVKLYGSKPMHNELCHESGLRILLNYTSRISGQFNFGIEPLLSISDMHYMRIFVRVNRGAKNAVNSFKEIGFASFCANCKAFSYKKGIAPSIEKNCENCNKAVEIFGPMWLGNLYDKEILKKMLALPSENIEAIEFIQKIYGEFDTPFFYSIPKITKSMHIGAVSPKILINTLIEKNKATFTQFDKEGIKTSANIGEIRSAVKNALKAV